MPPFHRSNDLICFAKSETTFWNLIQDLQRRMLSDPTLKTDATITGDLIIGSAKYKGTNRNWTRR